MCDAEKVEKVKQAAKLCTECNGVACRKCPYDEHNSGGIGVPMCGVVFATDVLTVIEQLQQRPDVVRCKDCKHSEKVNNIYVCGVDRHYVITRKSDWFCADGERKEGAADEEQVPG